jgi:serine protease
VRIIVVTGCVVAALLAGCGGGEENPNPSNTHSVSGVISPASLAAGATVALGTRNTTCDASGGFSFSGVAAGSYTVTPSKTGVTFTPASRSVTVGTSDVTGVDFTAQATGGNNVTLAGTITAARGQLVDSDTGDVNAPKTSNNTPASAQAIPSAVTLGGHADLATDDTDAFRGQFGAGQGVRLDIADADEGDLDLYLYAVSDTSNAVASSAGTGSVETLAVPSGGEFYVVVVAADFPGNGGSSYVLNVGAIPDGAGNQALRLEDDFVPGEIIVQLEDSGEALGARAQALGLVPLAGGARGAPALLSIGGGLARLGASPGMAPAFGPLPGDPATERLDTLRAVKALRRRRDVRSADPNYVMRPLATPNDQHYRYQWHYPLINLPQAWDITTGTPATGSVVVAVIDTGVFLEHPDMGGGQLVTGYDFIRNATQARDGDGIDANADDPGDGAAAGSSSWHGTHVAGTVAARSNEGAGVAGVAWGAKIMPIRVLGAGGGTSYDIIQGLRFAAGLSNDSGTLPARRADVANLSLGGGPFSQTAQDAFSEARATGMIIVAAAGNENTAQLGYPASYDGVVSVSAVDMARERAPYSNFGTAIDIAAPGGDTGADSDGNGFADGVLSPVADDSTGTRRAGWSFYQGTSMAAPHVAGVVALMKAVCPQLTPAQLDTLIAGGQMTTDLGTAGRDDIYGHGLVDALAAVRAAQAQCGATPATGLEVTPARLDFGAASSELTLAAAKQGTGALTVTSVSDNATWLAVTPTSVDASGIGSYRATVSRGGLASGAYSATIRFDLQGGASVTVPVSMLVGQAATTGDAGYLYVLLLDASLNTLGTAHGRGVDGIYEWSFTNVPPGQYFIVAGTDSDNDDLVCDAGEACGAWPTIGAPTPLEVTGAGNVSGLDFGVGFDVSLGAGAASAGAPRGGVRRLATPKRISAGTLPAP